VQCFVSDGEFSVSIGWHVTVAEWFIRSFAPDSIEIIARRETEVYFTLEIAAIENIELNFLWTLLDRNRRREEVGEVDSVTVCFDLAGEYQLESLVWRGEESDEVNWNIHVRSAVWYWWPQEDSLTVSVDSTLLFAITPFNPDSDSLEYLWTLDGDTIDFEREIEILFEDMGLYEVVAYVHDGCEADTIRWEVSVIPPVSSPIIANELMPTEPVLYPPSPNPFNSSVSLSYFLPQIEHVTLTIYNLGGRKVMSLVNVEQTAGNHTITWNAADQPAGMYLATLQTGDIRRIEKLILIP